MNWRAWPGWAGYVVAGKDRARRGMDRARQGMDLDATYRELPAE